jgi:hypothetical protein
MNALFWARRSNVRRWSHRFHGRLAQPAALAPERARHGLPFYLEEHPRGVRWNDPAFGTSWPLPDPILSPKDAPYLDFAG